MTAQPTATPVEESPAPDRQNRRYARSVRLWAAAACAIGLAVWWFMRDPNTLLGRARRVGPPGINVLAWVSDDELLASGPGSAQAYYLLNVQTGRQTPLPALSSELSKLPTSARVWTPRPGSSPWPVNAAPAMDVSPDGQWLLWASPGATMATIPGTPLSYHALRIDGTKVVSWKRRAPSPAPTPEPWYGTLWRRDSNRWLRLGFSHWDELAEAYEYKVDDPSYERKVPLKASGFYFAMTGQTGKFFSTGVPGAAPSTAPDGYRTLTLIADGLAEGRTQIRLPDGEMVRSVHTAWRTDRLLLEGFYREPAEASAFTVWLRNLTGRQPSRWFIFWTCDADGSHLREVGRMRHEPSPYKGGDPDEVRLFGMSPTGKRMAFFLRDELYVTDLP